MGADDLRTAVLAAHIIAGTIAVLIAIRVISAGLTRQDWGTRWGTGYVACVIIVAATAVLLSAAGSAMPVAVRWILTVIAIATAAAALRGRHLARGHHPPPDPSRPRQLRLMWGSLTSLVSAIAIVSAPAAVWVPVVVAGTLLTELGYRRARRNPGTRADQ